MKKTDIPNCLHVTNPLSRAVVASLLIMTGNAHAGVLTTGQSIVFGEDDFSSYSASRQWAVYAPNSVPDTNLFDVATEIIMGSGNSDQARVGTLDQTRSFDQSITWRIEVPDIYEISSFTWGFDTIRYSGTAGGATTIEWQYSSDNINWTTFSEVITLNTSLTNWQPEAYTVNLDAPIGSELYIRIFKDYTSQAQQQFFVYSNYGTNGSITGSPTPGGGFNERSFIEVTVVPEPSTTLLLLASAAGMLGLLRRRG